MLDIDAIRIKSVSYYLKWSSAREALSRFSQGGEMSPLQKEVKFSGEPFERLKIIAFFLSEGDFATRSEALDVALVRFQAATSNAATNAARYDRNFVSNSYTFEGFMKNAQKILSMMENSELEQDLGNFLMNSNSLDEGNVENVKDVSKNKGMSL